MKIEEKINTIRIGKNGITDELINEIKAQLNKHGVLRVRILRAARISKDRFSIAEEVSRLADAELVLVRGNTFILQKYN
ncbi:MAG: RNA-binding protein [Candidatus Altiarchaeales archaeon]|nr:MAG: RNA-binding protein [Candidatus Altiarchaeales archaeon]RLI93996.1 MAG: RNA-binding protein [Candidatus Altiarchaeales archaeon]HDO82774.1 YhbY family RNA-binding protein [Candidatus Altiarchaeales archaeon]HEX55423.1 YhbY family RNA-binding protein [Candidatus Altiarchaeales archaeon]